MKYRIKHTKFKNTKVVTPEQWKQMADSGNTKYWEIIETLDGENDEVDAPDENADADKPPVYGELIADAELAEKAAKEEPDAETKTALNQQALELYTKAFEMKETQKVKKKMEYLTGILGEVNN